MTTSIVHTANENGGDIAGGGSDILQFATFYLGDELFGINILKVQEVQLPNVVSPIPRAPSHIIGLLSLRGNIVTLVDLRRCLGLPPAPADTKPFHIVVNTAYTIACLQVDEIGDVIDVPAWEVVGPPESVRAVDAKYLEGVSQTKGGVLAILNVDAILERT